MGEINFVITGEAVAGPTGPAGPAGADSTVAGADGVDGTQGPTGAAGADGTQGPTGPAGQSITGPQGPAGVDSIVPGPQGIQGEAGADSTVAGADGVDGTQGPTGAAGADGTQGPTGPAGQSITGPQGQAGQSITGPQGIQGESITGPQGPQGIQGPAGPAGGGGGGGDGGNVINTYTKANLPETSTDGSQALITDGMSDNTWCMGYFYLGEWYRTFDNSVIEDETAPFITNIGYFPTPSDNTTPTISFDCNEVGYIESSLSFTSTTIITNGNNIITFNIPIGLYANQTITINDIQGNYTTVVIPEFQITTPPDLIPPVITVLNHIPTTGINTQPTMTFHSNEVGTIFSSLSIIYPSPPNIIVGNNTIQFDLSVGSYSGEAITIYDTNNNHTTITLQAFGITAESTSGYDTTALDSISINKLGWWSAYDTDDFNISGDVVLSWLDKTGNNNNLQQVDGKDTIRSSTEGEGVAFNGSSSLINDNFYITEGDPYTLVLVFEKASSASRSWLIDSRVIPPIGSSRNTVYSDSTGYITAERRRDAEPDYSFYTPTINANELGDKDILIINFNGATSRISQNGALTNGILGSGAMVGITVGSLSNGASGYGIDGKIYEIIYFDGIITTAETTIIEYYLTTKWDI